MPDLKNPFGLRDGNIVMIEDISFNERGLKCNCVCPACKDPFEARLGKVRAHHFAHSGEGCSEEIAYLNGLYMLVKEYVLSSEIVLPELKVFWRYCETRYTKNNFFERIQFSDYSRNLKHITVFRAKSIRFEAAETISVGKRPSALLLSYQSHQMALCIKPPSTVCKAYTVKPYNGMATLQLDASGISFGEQKKDQILKTLRTKAKMWSWIYNPLAVKAIDEINKANDMWIQSISERKKQRAEEMNLRKEQFKQRETEPIYQESKTNTCTCITTQTMSAENDQEEERLNAGYWEVVHQFTQQSTAIRDSYGQRWIQCRRCKGIKPDREFAAYGGLNSVNSGICSECSRKESSKNKVPL